MSLRSFVASLLAACLLYSPAFAWPLWDGLDDRSCDLQCYLARLIELGLLDQNGFLLERRPDPLELRDAPRSRDLISEAEFVQLIGLGLLDPNGFPARHPVALEFRFAWLAVPGFAEAIVPDAACYAAAACEMPDGTRLDIRGDDDPSSPQSVSLLELFERGPDRFAALWRGGTRLDVLTILFPTNVVLQPPATSPGPVPEPGARLLFALGLLAIALARRVRRVPAA